MIDALISGKLTDDEIKAALEAPTPCDNCGNRERCAAGRLACQDFATFARIGKVRKRDRIPSAALYWLIVRNQR